MRPLFCIFLIIACWTGLSCRAESFLPETEDIPLMAGIELAAAEDISFDTPAGQILTIHGTGKTLRADEVFSFYDAVLPALGWRRTGSGRFARGEDTFRLKATQGAAALSVRFDIFLTGYAAEKPAAAGGR